MGRAPGGSGDLGQAELARVNPQLVPQIQVPWPLPLSRRSAAQHHLRTYFITITTYSDAAMHYNIRTATAGFGLEALDGAAENPSRRAPPARMNECDGLARCHQVYRYTISNGHGEQNARRGGDPTIHAIDVDPTAAGIEAHDLDTVHLQAEGARAKVAQLPAECEPAAHDFAYRLRTPEAEIEPAARLGSPAGDPGDDAVPFTPRGDLESGNGAWNRGFSDF